MRRTPGRDDTGTRTRRVVVLLFLGVVCALVLAPPLRLYLQQQQDISALRGEIEQRTTDVEGLQTEVDLWEDDAYVAARARERLNFVMPGEVGYVVPDPEPSAGEGVVDVDEPTPGAADVDSLLRPDAAPQGTWYDRLWSSVEAAGTGTTDPVLEAPGVGDAADD